MKPLNSTRPVAKSNMVTQQAPEQTPEPGQTQEQEQEQAPQVQARPEPIYVEPAPKEPTLLEKITILSDLGNACRNEDIIRVITALPNGERLYGLFVKAISGEIELLMNGPQKSATQVAKNAEEVMNSVYTGLQRLVQTIMAVEQGPAMMALALMVKQFGGGKDLPELSSRQATQQQHPAASSSYQSVIEGQRRAMAEKGMSSAPSGNGAADQVSGTPVGSRGSNRDGAGSW